MCGIAGIFALDTSYPTDESRLESALEKMRARGPDGRGSHFSPGVAIGHRRLAILDPANAPQPWIEPASRNVLSYNGEIYNFRELKQRFLANYELRSSGDTAVLSALLEEFGNAAVELLNGMFAFAWYQPAQHKIILVRDPLGIKPLYYSFEEGILRFASSIPALLELTNAPRRLDGVAAHHYITTGRTHLDGRCLIAGVSALRPGEVLELGGAFDQPKIYRFWKTPAIAEAEKDASAQRWQVAQEECRQRIQTSVEAQLVSDVPIGAFVSGGLDSAIIATSTPVATRARLFGYNVGYDSADYNEWPWVEELASSSGIATEIVSLGNGDEWSELAAQIRWRGLPLSTPNELAMRKLARAFSNRGKVALSGEGADEIFGGYVLPQASAFDYDRALSLAPDSPLHSSLASFYGQSKFQSRAQHYLLMNSWTRRHQRNQWLNPDFCRTWQGESEVETFYENAFAEFSDCTTAESYLHMHTRVNLEGLLERVDASTMAESIEVRVPFTDHNTVAWAFGLPVEWKLRLKSDHMAEGTVFDWARSDSVESKRILRSAFENSIPQSILGRRKFSFPTPFEQAIQGSWQEQARSTLSRSKLLKGMLSTAPEKLMHSGISSWLWLNLAIWAEEMEIDSEY